MRSCVFLAIALTAAAQTPQFEVASVRPAESGAIGIFTYPGGRVVANGETLEMLIEQAFNLHEFQISGGPGWIRTERYAIDAPPPAALKSYASNPSNVKLPPNDEQRQMLQSLLKERFHLIVRREVKDGPLFLLTKGSRELKLREPKDKAAFPWAGGLHGGRISGDGLAGVNISMHELAFRLTQYLGRPVIDNTGLDGSFDFQYDEVSGEDHPDVAGWIVTSLQALGLKLESSRGPVETMTVESAEKPSQN